MASSQNQRYQDRLAARHRGAGTHKVEDLGFTIKPLGPPPAAKTVVPPLLLSPRAANPESATPIQPPPAPQRYSPPVARNDPPTVNAPVSATRDITGSSLPREGAASSGTLTRSGSALLASPELALAPKSTVLVARRTSPRGVSTPIVSQAAGTSSAPRNGTPTSHVSASRASTRSTVRRPHAVADVTPVARGKRMRQPSPDKFLVTPEAGINGKMGGGILVDGGVVDTEDKDAEDAGNHTGEEGKEDDLTLQVVDDETEDETAQSVVEDATIEVEDELDNTVGEDATVEEEDSESSAIAIKSPENRNKRRKVILEELHQKPEDAPLAEVGEPETPRPKLKRQTTGKKPAPPQIPEDEEEEEEEAADAESELQAEPSGLKVSGEGSRPQPRKIPAKPHATTQPKPKTKPRRRAQRPDSDEPMPTFPVIVHRLGKSGTFALPPGSQRAGVNPIDVISQVSMEIIDRCFLKAKSNAERKAVESFKEELSLRFLELTDVVEHNITLTSRTKQAQKRKAQLMLELLSIKQDREGVAVKMDDARKAHELAAKSSGIQQQMSKTFEDISSALERGKARRPEDGETGMDGLEALIRKVSAAVTGGGSSGTGLLATVVEFNRFLERTESALSGRRRRQ